MIKKKVKATKILWALFLQIRNKYPCSNSKESACNAGDLGLIPGLGRSPEEGNEYSPQYCS